MRRWIGPTEIASGTIGFRLVLQVSSTRFEWNRPPAMDLEMIQGLDLAGEDLVSLVVVDAQAPDLSDRAHVDHRSTAPAPAFFLAASRARLSRAISSFRPRVSASVRSSVSARAAALRAWSMLASLCEAPGSSGTSRARRYMRWEPRSFSRRRTT